MNNERIYLSPPHLGKSEWPFIQEALTANWVAPVGPHLQAFEEEFCAATGAAHAAALSSGTAALHLALLLLGVGSGDEVLCSSLTFVASANPVLYLGAKPILVDSNRETWNLDPNLLADELKRRAVRNCLPKALILVHLYGQCADLDPILELCRHYEISLIEDAAEALGATYQERHAGTLGRLGIFSFNGNKIITTSGGGMLVSAERDLVEKARFLATQARDPAPHYQHSQLGYNYRLSNILAGIGRGQLQVLSERVDARQRNFDYYQKALGDLPGVTFMPKAPYGRPSCWLTCLTLDPALTEVTPERIRLSLEEQNIECRPVWKPLHLQPLYAHCPKVGGAVAEELFRRGLCLPSGSALTEGQRQRVVEIFRSQFKEHYP